jgi:glutathionyl-hydroquinone reductase
VRAGLTTSQTTHEVRLTELLNSLESVVDNLNFKSFTVYDTLNTAMENLRVALSNIATDEAGTDTL